ncbi:SET1B methyltransferase, partial [Thalassarche chlororhynchos]|nr:SET1B methyltransferase [Thalassarche chlororhynchos]
EDMRFLRVTYERLLQEDSGTHWLNDTHWVHHTDILPGAGQRGAGDVGMGVRVIGVGCVGAGDVGMGHDHIPHVPWAVSPGPCPCPQCHDGLLWAMPLSPVPPGCPGGCPCGCPPNDVSPPLPQFRKKRLRFGRSRIHEWGLFAMEPIAADEMVIEYVGQNIRQV